MRAYCLRAALVGQPLQLYDLADPDLRAELEKKPHHSTSQDGREFEEQIGVLLPWHHLRAETILGDHTKEVVLTKLEDARQASAKASEESNHNDTRTADEIALIWFEILVRIGATDAANLERFVGWTEDHKRPLYTPTLTAIARLGSRHANTRAMALEFAARAFKLARDERAHADSKSSSYMSIARSVLIASPEESKAYFNEAIAVASKIGDENLSRWDATLDLAQHAARPGRPVPEIAYRLSRCAELTYDYVARDKHFNWTATVTSLAALCPNSCLSIMSRWRDRRFGRLSRVLPIAVHHLIDLGYLDPCDALPFVAIEAEWNHAKLLDAALKSLTNQAQREAASHWLLRNAVLGERSATEWASTQEVLKRHKINFSALDAYAASAQAHEKRSEQRRREDGQNGFVADDATPELWDAIFVGHDLSTVSGLSNSYRTFRESPPPRYSDRYFSEAFRRVAPGREAALIEAASQVPEFTLFDLRNLLVQLPETLKGRPAITQSLAVTLKAFCRRFCMGITNNRHYEVLPLHLACELASIKEAEEVEVVLDAIGESGDLPSAGRLFSLAGLLTFKVTSDEALEGLQYGLNLFDALLEDKDGGGPWKATLAPPQDLQASVARFAYARLASPAAPDRWVAAHAVLGFCVLERRAVLSHLVDAANTKSVGPFVDASLPFYEFHALQWLQIAFSRAALEYPQSLAPHTTAIISWALNKQDHVHIRAFAARTAIAIAQSGAASVDAAALDRLRQVNRSHLAPVQSKAHLRVKEARRAGSTKHDDEFYFGIDFGPYWYAPLGTVFALSQRDVEEEALKVIRGELGYTSKGGWAEDPREVRKLYGRTETYASHSSYPSADNHSFYLCYHAMLIAAGKFLGTRPLHFDQDSDKEDEFTDWLNRHDVTRKEGRWLFDRRDPSPLEQPAWHEVELDNPAWKELHDTDFDLARNASAGLCVWGDRVASDSNKQETTTVRSALVAPGAAMALLRALSSSNETRSYQIPSAGSGEEIEAGPFELKGWISDRSVEREIDRMDPWSGDVRHPAPAPATAIVEQCGLTTDADGREWLDKTGANVLSSRVWGGASRKDDDDDEAPAHGTTLVATRPFVQHLLSRLDRDLIFFVELERRRRYRPHERRSDDDGAPKTATRICIFRADGSKSVI